MLVNQTQNVTYILYFDKKLDLHNTDRLLLQYRPNHWMKSKKNFCSGLPPGYMM